MARNQNIKNARIRVVVVPLRRPVIADIGEFREWPLILTDIELCSGVTGISYIAPYRSSAVRSIVAEIRDVMEEVCNAPTPFEASRDAKKSLNVIGVSGVSTLAIAAVDMALWDANCKEAGLPLACMLGGSVGPVQTYNSNGLWRHSAETLGAEAKELLAEGGFTALKLRLGNTLLQKDLDAIQSVQEAVGPGIDLMVDFNQALGLGDAIRRCSALDDLGLYWIEEPVIYDNVLGYQELAQRIRTPIQMGENLYGERDLMNFVRARAAHYVMPDLMRIGGISGWIRTSGVAAAAGMQMSNHLYPEVCAHLLRATPTAHWLEYVDWASPILEEPVVPQNGFITALDKPGIGIAWDDKAVAKYAVAV